MVDLVTRMAHPVFSGASRAAIVEGPTRSGKSALIAAAHNALVAEKGTSASRSTRLPRPTPGHHRPAGASPVERGLFGPAGATAHRGPLALLVDDAHWADTAGLALLSALLRGPHPVLLVLTRDSTRTWPADAGLAAIAADPRTRLLALPHGHHTPRRDPVTTAVRTAAAVLGSADPLLLAALTGLALPTVRSAVRAGAAAHATAPAAERAALLATIPRPRLDHLRAGAARVLNDTGRPARQVADQLLALPDAREPWMAPVLAEAAADATAAGDTGTAAAYLRRARTADPTDPAPRLALARVLLPTDPDAARAELDAPALDTHPAAAVLRAAATGLGTPPRQVADAIRRHHADPTTPLPPGTLAALCGNRPDARAALAADLGRTTTAPDTAAAAVHRLATLALAGRAPAAVAASARGLLAATGPTATGPTATTAAAPATATTLLRLGGVLCLAEEPQHGLRALDLAAARAATADDPTLTGRVLAARSLALRDSGDHDTAVADAEAATLAHAAHRGAPSTLAAVADAVGLFHTGDHPAAARALAAAAHVPGARPSEQHLHLFWTARTAAATGDTTTALRLLHRCAHAQADDGIAHPAFAPWWCEAALLTAALGRPAEAAAHAERGADLTRTWPTAKATGLVLLARGVSTPDTTGVDLLTEAARVLATTHARPEHARAEHLLGRALLRRDDRTTARAHLRRAALLAEACGWRDLATAARRELAVAGGRMRSGPRRTGLLTTREREVADLVARGASNREAAAALFVSASTVELHLTKVYRKLAVSSRADLAAALRDDPTPPPGTRAREAS
ncbi:response regulator transcription factor [Actinokineospora bangkokensis]|uniref:HTH luxR-type domain-containing protein n=1 Tax=Actinokineospora bangkokensis TaxID=1193682 RepID=A0A1Q9LP12_9PSEU|nr:helix-turn-helix transcriptional regulator [Actinokineospora bangkokensis]OLR93797.1 hypothetical protein BJP25_16285 [Actinokineospora bangkokensis]